MTYFTTHGNVKIKSKSYPFVVVQPGEVLRYSAVYTDCSSQFQVLDLPKEEWGSGTGKHRLLVVNNDGRVLLGLLEL